MMKRPHLLPQVRATAKIGVRMAEEIVPQVFNNPEFGQLRVLNGESGGPRFVAKDVLSVLALDHTALRKLDDDERGRDSIPTPGGNQLMVTVSEAGLYTLVLSSKKPEAKAFKRWVTHEVLPSIRRDGGYMVTQPNESDEDVLARALLIAQHTLERKNKVIEEQSEQIEELKPKALFADAVAASDGTCLVGELAKMLRQNGVDIGQNRLFSLLREQGFLGKSGQNYNVPTQRAMEMGLFRIKETAITHSDGHVTINRTPKVTGKGQRYFVNRFCVGG